MKRKQTTRPASFLDMVPPPPPTWIRERLKELKIKHTDFADRLGINKSRVTELIQGKRNLKIVEIPPAAAVLKLSPFEVLVRVLGEAMDTSEPTIEKQYEILRLVSHLDDDKADEAIRILRAIVPPSGRNPQK